VGSIEDSRPLLMQWVNSVVLIASVVSPNSAQANCPPPAGSTCSSEAKVTFVIDGLKESQKLESPLPYPSITAEQSSPEQSSPEQSPPEQSPPEQSSPEQSSPEQSSPEQSSPEQSSPEQSSPELALVTITSQAEPTTTFTANVDIRTYAAVISALIALLAMSFNIFITLNHKKREIRKSVYDDLFFREIFLKPFNKSLNEFVNKWSNKAPTYKPEFTELEEIVSDAGKLQDLAQTFQIISEEKWETLLSYIDELPQMISDQPEEEIQARNSLSKIHRLFLTTQEEMMNNNYEPKAKNMSNRKKFSKFLCCFSNKSKRAETNHGKPIN